jgi:hypothetical protein
VRAITAAVVALLALAGCVAPVAEDSGSGQGAGGQPGAQVVSSHAPADDAVIAGSSPPVEPAAVPVDTTIDPVSLSRPPADAERALELCRVRDWVDRNGADVIAGMGKIEHAKDAVHYARLTGLEPELQSDRPAWIVQFRGDIRVDWELVFTDPVCIVVDGDGGFFGTGPVRQVGTEVMFTPQPAKQEPDRALPPLGP